jgi:hypothetical protein
MRTRLIPMTLGLLAAAAPSLVAHHSFAAEYDANQPVKVSGVVTRVDWQNPHIWFFVDVKDDQGKVTNWGSRAALPACCSAAASAAPRSRPATWWWSRASGRATGRTTGRAAG